MASGWAATLSEPKKNMAGCCIRLHLRIYNADHEADYANGFEPDVKIEELVIGNDLLPFGDTNERLLSEALSRISGLKSLPVHAESEGRILLTPSSLERKQTKGLIFEEGK